MLKYLVPNFPIADLPVMLALTFLGSAIAGIYGVLHDHITYLIGPEYFTHFKFEEFQWADLHMGDRIFVSCTGFLSTWWVGLIVAWILARRMLPNQPRRIAVRKIFTGFAIVFAVGLLFGLGGYALGLIRGPDADYSIWTESLNHLEVSDHWSFIRVGYIHNAGYLGNLVGLVLTYFLVKPNRAENTG